MTDAEATRLRDDYLARLDEAMRALPHGVAADIRQGVAEELAGLDAEAARERIAQLGDPADIAREAADEVPAPSAAAPQAVAPAAPTAAPAAAPAPATGTSSRGFAIAAALTLAFGGFLVPFIGWVVGAVLVCLSPLWRAWEKAVAILLPFGVAVLSWLLLSSMSFTAGSAGGSSSGTGPVPEGNNPLVPDLGGFGAAHSILILAVLIVPVSGLWLLWRLRGRRAV